MIPRKRNLDQMCMCNCVKGPRIRKPVPPPEDRCCWSKAGRRWVGVDTDGCSPDVVDS